MCLQLDKLNYNLGIFEKILPSIHNFGVHPKAKPSTFKNKNKNLQHPKIKIRTFNIQK
jgi:hypothetical protein